MQNQSLVHFFQTTLPLSNFLELARYFFIKKRQIFVNLKRFQEGKQGWAMPMQCQIGIVQHRTALPSVAPEAVLQFSSIP